EVVKVGDEVEVKILRVDTEDRKIGLSLRLDAPLEELQAEAAGKSGSGSSKTELRGGTGSGEAGPLFSMGGGEATEAPAEAVESAEAAEATESGEATEEAPAETAEATESEPAESEAASDEAEVANEA